MLLSKLVVNAIAPGCHRMVKNLVRASPFRGRANALLFPFLIIEAKSGKKSGCFEDIETQTALPILALLKLQENLHDQMTDTVSESGPLVWFFAYRGCEWRVYAGYVTNGRINKYVGILFNLSTRSTPLHV